MFFAERKIFLGGLALLAVASGALCRAETPAADPVGEPGNVAVPAANPGENVVLASSALRSGLTGLALEFTDDVLAEDESAVGGGLRDAALRIRASALIERGRFAEAEKALDAVGESSSVKALYRAWAKIGESEIREAGAALAGVVEADLTPSDAAWFELAAAVVAKDAGDDAAAERRFDAALKRAVGAEQRAQFEYVRAWANATFVPELSAAELEALRARADAATDPQERVRLARLYAFSVALDADRDPEKRGAARAVLARAADEKIPPNTRAELDFLDGVLQDSPKSESARRAFMRALCRRPDVALQEAAIAGLWRNVREIMKGDGVPAGEKKAESEFASGERKNEEAASAAAAEIDAFFDGKEIPGVPERLRPDPAVADLELFARIRIAGLVGGRENEIEKWANEILEKHPNSRFVPDVLRVLADEAMARREYRRAVPYLERLKDAAGTEDEKAEIGIVLADCRFLAGDYRIASSAYAKVAESAGSVARRYAGTVFSQRVLCELNAGDFAGAEELIDAARGNAALPFDREWVFRAECFLIAKLRGSGKLAAAEKRCAEFLAQPGVPETYRLRVLWWRALLGLELEAPKTTVAAADEIGRMLDALPPDARLPRERNALRSGAALLKARGLLADGDFASARAQLELLRAEFAEGTAVPASYLDEGRAYAERGQLADALRCFEKMIEICAAEPKFARYGIIAYFEAAQQEAAFGRFREAIARLEELIAKYPDSPLVFYARKRQADCFRSLNDFESALVVYESLIAKYPDHPDLRRTEIARADCLFALASAPQTDAGTRASSLRKAIAAYERLFSLPGDAYENGPGAAHELRAEAGYKWGEATAKSAESENLSPEARKRVRAEARKILWRVKNELFDRAARGNVDPSTRWGVSSGYWLARALFAVGDLCEADGDYDEARKAYKEVVNWGARWGIPGADYARAREEAIRDK